MKVTLEPVIVMEDGDRIMVTIHSDTTVSIHHFKWRITMSAEQARALAREIAAELHPLITVKAPG